MRSVAILVLAALFTITTTSSTNAAALWWKKVITRQKTHQRCMQAAQDGVSRTLRNIRISPDEVSGTSLDEKVYVAITCVERGGNQRAVAIIAGVGDDPSAVRPVVDNTAEQVRTSGTPEY